MKWVNRFKDKVSTSSSEPESAPCRDQPNNGSTSIDRELELDFKRFWEVFRTAVSDKEKEEALGMAIGTFCKLARQIGDPLQLVNMLVDMKSFAVAVAKSIVIEINKMKTLNASGCEIVEKILYFFVGEKNHMTTGANMLYVLECLVSPPLDVQPLLNVGLLSCLIWVLYILLDRSLKELDSVTKLVACWSVDTELQNNYKLVMEGSMIHIMKALSQCPLAVQGLVGDDSLQLIFHIAIMSPYSSDFDILNSTLSLAHLHRQSLQILRLLVNNDNGSSAKYIHDHQLVNVLLKTIEEFGSSYQDSEHVVAILDLLLECIGLSCRPESLVWLRDDLQAANGYDLLVQFALNTMQTCHSQHMSPEGQSTDAIPEFCTKSEMSINSSDGSLPLVTSRLLDILVELSQIGVNISKGISDGKATVHKSTNENEGHSAGKVKDKETVRVLQDIFLKSANSQLQLEVLDRLLRIFSSHQGNYAVCQELRTLPLFILNMHNFPDILQERLLKILEYAVTVVNCVPEQELLSLCCLLQQPLSPSLCRSILSFFTKVLSFDKQYKKVLREVGGLEVLLDDLKKLDSPLIESPSFRLRSFSSKDLSRQRSLRKSKSNKSLLKSQLFINESLLGISWDCLVTMLKGDEANQMAFRKANGVTIVLPLLSFSRHRAGVLRLLNCLICEDVNQSHPEEFGALIEVAKSGVADTLGQQIKVDMATKRDVLWTIFRILGSSSSCKDVFGASTGFSLLLTVLHSFQSQDDANEGTPTCDKPLDVYMEVFDALMNVAKAAVSGNAINRSRLQNVISSHTFKDLLRESGLLSSETEKRVADLFLGLAIEKKGLPGELLVLSNDSSKSDSYARPEISENGLVSSLGKEQSDVTSLDLVFNAGPIEVLISCLKHFSVGLQMKILDSIRRLAQSSALNKDCISGAGCVTLLLEVANSVDNNMDLLEQILSIVEILGSYRLSSTELRTLARWVWSSRNANNKEYSQKIVNFIRRLIHLEVAATQNSYLVPFVQLSMRQFGYACMRISLGDRTWPPQAGYSFACWMRYKNLSKQESSDSDISIDSNGRKRKSGLSEKCHPKVRIFSVGSVDEKSQTYAELYMNDNGDLVLATSNSSFLSFKGVHLEEGLWHHVVVVHNKPNALTGLFQSSSACLYINGKLKQTGKLGYSASSTGKKLQVTIGTSPSDIEILPLCWELSSCYLFEEVLPAPAVFFTYILGRSYRGLFQDADLPRLLPNEACGGGNLSTFEALELELALGSNQKSDSNSRVNAFKSERSGVFWDLDRLATFANQIASKKMIFCFDGTRVDVAGSGSHSLVNLVDPLSSAASPFGGLPRIARLYGDISICSPCSLGENLRKIGGVAVVLALVEAAENKEMLHLAISFLADVLRWSPQNIRDMSSCRGYHLLALFLHHRMCYFDIQHLDILFQIAASEASLYRTGGVTDSSSSSGRLDPSLSSNNLDSSISGEGVSPSESQVDSNDYFQQDIMSPKTEAVDVPTEICESVVLTNSDMMEYVLLDWTLWSASPVTIQIAVLEFIEQLVSMHRYRNHNLTMLRRVNIVQHLLVTLQRGDVEIPVLEKLVVLLGIILEDGFQPSELKSVVDFVVMTFEPPEVIDRTVIPREQMGVQVVVRNMLLEMLLDLQVTISSEDVLELWHKVVSSKLITFLLDEAVHPTSMRWVMTLLGVCLSSSNMFVSKYRGSGGFQGLAQVLPSFFDCPELYYILFCLILGKPVYPRQPEVRMLDFHELMPENGTSWDLMFVELLESVVAMAKTAFDRLTLQLQFSKQNGDPLQASFSINQNIREVLEAAEQLQGEALMHKTYAARLLGGEAAAPAVATSILRYMVDLAKICQAFLTALRRQPVLESCTELYFSCVRSAYAAENANQGELVNPVDVEDADSSHVTSSDSPREKPLFNMEPKFKSNGATSTAISIPLIVSKNEKNNIASLGDDALPSEDIVCDMTLFEVDGLDHLFVLAAASDESSMSKVVHDDMKTPSPPGKMNNEMSNSRLALVPGSPISEQSVLVDMNKPMDSMSVSPFDLSASWLGSSARSETTRSTSTSLLNSEVYYKLSSPGGESPGCSIVEIKPDFLLKLDNLGASGGPCSAASVAVLDLIAEVLAEGLCEQVKFVPLVEAILESAPLFIATDTAVCFQGLCLTRLTGFLERRLLRDEEEVNKKLDKSKWTLNLDAFSVLLVDRVYIGSFGDPGSVLKVLEFLLSMLQLANKDRKLEDASPAGKGLLSRNKGSSRQIEPYVQSLLKSVNRMIMYCFTPPFLTAIGEDELVSTILPGTELRRPEEDEDEVVSVSTDVCTVLKLVLVNRTLIFCPVNMDADLVCCLCVNSVTLLWDSRPSVRLHAIEVMRTLIAFRKPDLEELLVVRANQGEPLDVLHGGLDRLLHSKDVTQFYVWFRNSKEIITRALEQCALIMWMKYVTNAAKSNAVYSKVGEGRRRREMSRRNRDISKIEDSHWEKMIERRYALDVIRDGMATDLRALRQDKYGWVLHAESEWEVQVQHLVHERAVFPMLKVTSNDEPDWVLCPTEGPYRMRKKFVRCRVKIDMSSATKSQLLLESSQNDKTRDAKDCVSWDITDPDYDSFFHLFSVGNAHQSLPSYSTKELLESFDDDEDDMRGREGSTPSSAKTGSGQSRIPVRSNSVLSGRTSTIGDFSASYQSSPRQSSHMSDDLDKEVPDDGEYLIRPFLQTGDKIRYRYNCERVVGLEKKDGLFLIGEMCLYVIENFYIDDRGHICEKIAEDELSVIDQALGVTYNSSSGAFQEQKQNGSWQETTSAWLGGRAWTYNGGAWGRESVQCVSHIAHPWRMWKLDSVHELLKRWYQLRPVAIELFSMDGCNDLLVFHKNERDEVFKNLVAMNLPRNSMLDSTISGAAKQESSEGGRLFKMMAKSFSTRWQNGEISNFQYLMHLNTLAGRGYNDLTQYPVFPWILADYDSENLNLDDPKTFRSLNKPMGALTPEREEEFKRRYDSWDDPEIPSFHYGSHYSSAGTVLFYLIRVPPFSYENKQLQGGQFDHADRLFNTIKDTWYSASEGNTADVKELIPEFFYLPEMLENRFNLDLGWKQSGEKVNNVRLPPWANGSAREFIRKHREALESQYVSENLHHWIDLIFGYKQQGQAAVDATNVFFYLTYEGAVDIDSITDPSMKASILAQINHFGQTPRQLFQKPHPQRKVRQKPPPLNILKQHNLLLPQEIRTMADPVSQIAIVNDKVLAVGSNRILKPPSYSKYIAWGFPDRSLRFFTYDQDKLISTHEGLHGCARLQCAGVSKDGHILVTGGDDGVVAIWRLHKHGLRKLRHLQLQRTLCAHTERITCLTVCQSYSLIVSGSEDCTVIFWDLSTLDFVRQLPKFDIAPSAVYANEMTGDIVTASGTILSIWSINGDCLATVNASQLPSDTIVSVTSSCFSDWMENNWYITGHKSGSVKLWRMEHNSEVNNMSKMTSAGFDYHQMNDETQDQLLIQREDGGEGSLPEYQLVLTKVLKWHKQSITCLHLTNDLRQLFSGDSGGHLISWTLPDELLKISSLQENDEKL